MLRLFQSILDLGWALQFILWFLVLKKKAHGNLHSLKTVKRIALVSLKTQTQLWSFLFSFLKYI